MFVAKWSLYKLFINVIMSTDVEKYFCFVTY